MAAPAAAGLDFDAVVIGTGFAGAVTACRLTQAEQRICVLERGRRYGTDFPVYPTPRAASDGGDAGPRERVQPDFSRALWKLGHGLWDARDLGDLIVAQAAGYGGGSLIYANVHLRAPREALDDRWPEQYRGGALDPYYDLVAFMLGVQRMPEHTELPKTARMRGAAEKLERRGHFFRPPLAVNFGPPRQRFRRRQGTCDLRGECCFGCGAQAKGTLDLNYLALVEDAPRDGHPAADIRTLSEVVWIEQCGDRDDPFYRVEYRDHLAGDPDRTPGVTAKYVFLCAGAVNTTELLLRSSQAGKLPCGSQGLGTRFHPNADAIAAVFDCDEVQEADRGPTITSALLYDREEGDRTRARWRVPFTGGGRDLPVGSTIRGARASGILAVAPLQSSGSWVDQNAAGDLILRDVEGNFEAGESLRCGDERFGVAASAPVRCREWLLFQDGGMPTELEPLLGVFRSPLWLRRNRFREKGDGRSAPDLALADLPFDALTDVLSGLTPSAIASRRPLLHEVSEAFVTLTHLARRPEWSMAMEERGIKEWKLLPDQLREALEGLRRELLDRAAVAAEPLVDRFLDRTAVDVEREYLGQPVLDLFSLPRGLDADLLGQLELGKRLLNLAVQLVWGSQGELGREMANEVVKLLVPERAGLLRRATRLLQWALDYRLGDGHTGVLLSMGRDSLPGTLSLALPEGPPPGATVVGGASGAAGILVAVTLRPKTSWAGGNAAGLLVLAKVRGAFRKEEALSVGPRVLGTAVSEAQEWAVDPRFVYRDEALWVTARSLMLHAIEFRPAREVEGLRRLLQAPLRARLPESLDQPERAAQEQLLRDIAESWGGELRTDPTWGFLGRRLTVHAQGGCPMGRRPGEGFTEASGEVVGCPGLYVMDAAAFPTSVGVNPSATIAAIAECKVEDFIRSKLARQGWRARAHHAGELEEWLATMRGQLDAIPSIDGRSAPPGLKPIGIKFEERMTGGCESCGEELPKSKVETRLEVEIEDLGRFLELQQRGEPQRTRVGGEVSIAGVPGIPDGSLFVRSGPSYLQLLRELPDLPDGREQRSIDYHLVLGAGPEGGAGERPPSHVLEGSKTIRDDERFDLWEDATTLPFVLRRYEPGEEGVPILKGVLRLPASAFFGEQLPSFEATNTQDPARRSWALAAFGRFFFGHLVDVYVPELDRVVDVAKSLADRAHV